jgi:hypothetical protein
MFSKKAKVYRENHKDELKAYREDFYAIEENRIKKRQRDKEYRLKNLETVKAKQCERLHCELCGGTFTRSGKSYHMKSNTHLNNINKNE